MKLVSYYILLTNTKSIIFPMIFHSGFRNDCCPNQGKAHFAAKNNHLRRKFAVKNVCLHRKTILEYGNLSCFYQIIGT